MNNQDWQFFNRFVRQMITILQEKHEKHQDTWKDCPITFLRFKLRNQLNKSVLNEKNIDKEYNKRIFVHIANYCYFLYTRLEGDD